MTLEEKTQEQKTKHNKNDSLCELLFCGNSPLYLKEKLIKHSNEENGGTAYRIPSLINSRGTLVAAIDKQTSGADWGYIEVAVRRSTDGGKTWSPVESIAKPAARETLVTADSYASAFFIDPCMAIAPNGDIIMIVDFWPECKGLHNQRILDRKKVPYAMLNGRMRPLIYDRDGNFYYIEESGNVLNSKKEPTEYKVTDGKGSLYKGDEYVGNIYLNGKTGRDEANVNVTFGAPLKAPKRSYVFMLRSSDDGKTWSEPKDITHMILSPHDGTFLGVAPGTGLTTSDGRIIMPLYALGLKKAVSIYSVDNGETWHRMSGSEYASNIDEWQMIETPDGTVMGFGRQLKYGRTPVSVSTDKSRNWFKAKPTKIYAPKCQKSVISKGDYVFCSHASERKRANGVLTVGKLIRGKKGFTDTVEWYNEVPINSDFFAYSSLTFVDDDTIGVLYEDEPSSYIIFKTFKISDII